MVAVRVDGLAVAPDLEGGLVAGSRDADARGQLTGIHYRAAVELEDDIAHLDTRLRRSAVGDHLGHERTVRRFEFERVRQRLIERLHFDPEARMGHFAGLHDLIFDLHRQIDREWRRTHLDSHRNWCRSAR